MMIGSDFGVKINSEREYNAAIAEVERLFGSPVGSVASERFVRLATMVEIYDKENYAIGAPSHAAVQEYEAEKRGYVLV